MSELLIFLAGLFLGYAIGHRKVEHKITVDAKDAIKQLQEATKAVKELEKEIKW